MRLVPEKGLPLSVKLTAAGLLATGLYVWNNGAATAKILAQTHGGVDERAQVLRQMGKGEQADRCLEAEQLCCDNVAAAEPEPGFGRAAWIVSEQPAALTQCRAEVLECLK